MELDYEIAIIGQGYVGFPFVISFSKFYETIAYDISFDKIDELIGEYDSNLEVEVKANNLLNFSCNEDDIKDFDIFIITFSTDVKEYNLSNLSFINSALNHFGCSVDIFDPMIKIKHTNLIQNPFKESNKYDAIIAAVSDYEFYCYTINDFTQISNENLVLLDIKSIYDFSTWKF